MATTTVDEQFEGQEPSHEQSPAAGTCPDVTGPSPDADRAPDRLPVLRALVRVLVLTAFGALVCLAPLDLSMKVMQNDAKLQSGAAFVGWLLVWSLLLGLVALTGRVRWALAVALVCCCALGVANGMRLGALFVPLLPSDLAFLATPLPMVEIVGARRVVLVTVAVLALATVMGVLLRRLPESSSTIRRGRPGRTGWLVVRSVLVLQAAVMVALLPSFNQAGNPVRAFYDHMGAEWIPWSQGSNYLTNGFVGGMLYNLPTTPMDEPEGYSREAMARVLERWRDADESTAPNPPAGEDVLAGANVVIVLSESLGDPTQLGRKLLDEDPLPALRARSEQEWSGRTLGIYGTGTSTMEFQALTGQSVGLFPAQVVSPYQQFLTTLPDYPSMVGWLGSHGYRTVAIHPFARQMYKRTDVYDVMGFDEFVDQEDMEDVERASPKAYISDESAYEEVLRQIDDSDEPLLAHLVTMQNHVPLEYNPDPFPVTGLDDVSAAQVGDWARGLKISDDALTGLLEALEQIDEPTVVVFFGDHFPGVFPEDLVVSEGMRMRTMPLLVWASHLPSEHRDLGVVSPTSFMSVLSDRLGVEKPPYLRLLDEVQARIGTVRDGVAVSADGVVTPLDQLDAEQRELLDDYRLVQYDFSIGERWAVEDLWYDLD